MAYMMVPGAIRTPLLHWAAAHWLLIGALLAAIVFATLAKTENKARWRRVYAACSVGTLASLIGYEVLVAI